MKKNHKNISIYKILYSLIGLKPLHLSNDIDNNENMFMLTGKK